MHQHYLFFKKIKNDTTYPIAEILKKQITKENMKHFISAYKYIEIYYNFKKININKLKPLLTTDLVIT